MQKPVQHCTETILQLKINFKIDAEKIFEKIHQPFMIKSHKCGQRGKLLQHSKDHT